MHNINQRARVTDLAIADKSGDRVRIGFGAKGIGIAVNPPDILEATGEDIVRVEGEDLFALRELLNELPEEAFVRPADTAIPQLIDGDGWLWLFSVKHDGWRCVGGIDVSDEIDDDDIDGALNKKGETVYKGLESFERLFAENGGNPLKPKVRWTDGDVVAANTAAGAIWTRHKGVWNLPHGVTGSRNVEDATISDMVDGGGYGPWTVLRQQKT